MVYLKRKADGRLDRIVELEITMSKGNQYVRRVCVAIARDRTFERDVLGGALRQLRNGHLPAMCVTDFDVLRRCPAEVRGFSLTLLEDRWIGRLRRLRRPVVNVSVALEPVFFPSVVTDNLAIGRMAAEHFWDRVIAVSLT
jgi:hypothetical protein